MLFLSQSGDVVKYFTRAAAALLTLSFPLAAASMASAQPISGQPTPREQSAAISLAIAQGASDADLASRFHLTRRQTTQTSPSKHLTTSPSWMTENAPKIYWQSTGIGTGYYYLVADWGWRNHDWKYDTPTPYIGSMRNVGGLEAFGVHFTTPIQNRNGTLTVCGGAMGGHYTSPGCFQSTAYIGNNQYGEMVTFQDKSFAWAIDQGETNAERGTLVFPFSWLSNGCRQFGSTYAHTWNSTSINGVSIGSTSVGVQWSTTSSDWALDSPLASFTC